MQKSEIFGIKSHLFLIEEYEISRRFFLLALFDYIFQYLDALYFLKFSAFQINFNEKKLLWAYTTGLELVQVPRVPGSILSGTH